VRIKAEVVSADERETGVRRILNFSRTFRRVEAETLYARYLHGQAVGFRYARRRVWQRLRRLKPGEGAPSEEPAPKNDPFRRRTAFRRAFGPRRRQ
jgi:hypothetical protein